MVEGSSIDPDLLAKDVPSYSHLLSQIEESADQIQTILTNIKDKISNGPLKNHKDGLDLLNVKVQIMSSKN